MSNPNAASKFDEIYDSTIRAVLIYVTSKCGRIEDVNDIIQDTYMELYQLLIKRGAGYITNEKALVLRIAKNRISKYFSLAERLRIFVSAITTNDDGDEVNLSELEADSFLLENFVINQMLLEDARQFIKQKPEAVKKVFFLFYDVGLTIPEIAEELSLSESNVKNKLYRTLKELRKFLDGKGA